MAKVGICFIFNHPFPKQIPVLRKIYGARFSKILFLIPFHIEEEDPDVHTVYDGAFSFDAMIVDARDKIKERFKDCAHVLFVHNDLMLAGRYNENSTEDLLKLAECPFTARLVKLGGSAFDWVWKVALPYKWRFPMDPFLGSGAERAKYYLPTREFVSQISEEAGYGAEATTLAPREAELDNMYFYRFVHQQIYLNQQHVNSDHVFEFDYPLYGGYADMFAVPMARFSEWIHTMGTLSSMQLFPEITIPTALVWTFGKLNTEYTLALKTAILWNEDRNKANDIDWVIGCFQDGCDFIHPVKYEKYPDEAYDNLIEEISRSSTMSKIET